LYHQKNIFLLSTFTNIHIFFLNSHLNAHSRVKYTLNDGRFVLKKKD